MKMPDWDALIGEEIPKNAPPSGELPHCFLPVSEIVGKAKPNNSKGFEATSPLSPPSPLKKQGGGKGKENETRAGGGATDEFSAAIPHPVSPLAVCLLLACCDRIKADEQEAIGAILSLKHCTPAEQVRAWALSCSDNGIDPYQVQHPVAPSPGKGVECRGCVHLAIEKLAQPSGRRVFSWVCRLHHALLELGYAGECILIAPPGCSDYAGSIHPVRVE